MNTTPHHPPEHNSYSYVGTYDHTIRNGYGKLHFFNSYFYYEGNYLLGKRHGPGTLYLGNYEHPDIIIKGNFVDGELEGWGTKIWSDGKIYTGEFKHGEIEGQGRLEIPALNMYYEGEFLRGAFHGTGKQTITITSSSSSSIPDKASDISLDAPTSPTGNVQITEDKSVVSTSSISSPSINNTLNTISRPTIQTEDGNTSPTSPIAISSYYSTSLTSIPASYVETYTGQFQYNKRDGQGRLERDNHPELIYEGNFSNNMYSSEGILYYDNQGYYKGEWLNNKKHGKGILLFPKQLDSLSYNGTWINDVPQCLPSSLFIHILPWKLPKITSWPPPPPAITTPEATSAPTTGKATASKDTKAATKSAPATTKTAPIATAPPNPHADLPLYRPGAVVVPVGGKLPTIKVSVMYAHPEKKIQVEEARAKAAAEAAAKAAEEAALAAAEAERKRLEAEVAAAANKGKKAAPVTTPAPKTAVPVPTSPEPSIPPSLPNPDGWKNSIEEYEELYTGESGRHIEITFVFHETIKTQFSTEIITARETAAKAAAEKASTEVQGTGNTATATTKPGAKTATGGKVTSPPTSPRSPSKLKSSITKITTVNSFMRIAAPAVPPPSIEPLPTDPQISVLVPSIENSQRDIEQANNNEVNSIASGADINEEIYDLSTLLSTNNVHTFTNQGIGLIQQVYIPLTLSPGQYTMIIQDNTLMYPYGKKLKPVYIPIDILPSNAW